MVASLSVCLSSQHLSEGCPDSVGVGNGGGEGGNGREVDSIAEVSECAIALGAKRDFMPHTPQFLCQWSVQTRAYAGECRIESKPRAHRECQQVESIGQCAFDAGTAAHPELVESHERNAHPDHPSDECRGRWPGLRGHTQRRADHGRHGARGQETPNQASVVPLGR